MTMTAKTQPPKLGSLEYWRQLAAYGTTRCTPEQLDQIAAECLRAQEAGEVVGVWHSASVVFGTLDRCCCVPCSKARGGKAASRFAA